ncbi:hypothetical protein B0H15DRAFT_1020358 [Mycena belliarum]|uniref:Uncharacterized protein n=1 Tax=Mycena belliarum TaxID=1033014 RepID=A0AAD6U7Z5_9AGAR|nr:hypothetical protein B0H15DRAFT_1020358 [Mycena belliae]
MSAGYLAHLLHVCWAFLLSLFSSRPRKRLSSPPELPTSSPLLTWSPRVTNAQRDAPYQGPESWQRDKQQFLRRPSLVRADSDQGTRTHESRKKKRTMAPPPPEIYIQDWSSLGLVMTDMFNSPSTPTSRSGAVGFDPQAPSSMTSAGLSTIPEDSSLSYLGDAASTDSLTAASHSSDDKTVVPDPTEAADWNSEADSSIYSNQDMQDYGVQDISEPPVVTFTGGYASNPLSALSGLLWDPPSVSDSHSIPIPGATPVSPAPVPQATPILSGRDSVLPYPDLFDFSMYTRRISRDSLCDALEMPSLAFTGNTFEKKGLEPGGRVSIYDVLQERDRYRSAAYSSSLPSFGTPLPRRPPFASTINLRAGKDAVDLSSAVANKPAAEDLPFWNGESAKDSIGAYFLAACDELSRCEWTEEEFLKMFASSSPCS